MNAPFAPGFPELIARLCEEDDVTNGWPALRNDEREVAERGLEQVLLGVEFFEAHTRSLQKRFGKNFRHRALLDDDLMDRIAREGVGPQVLSGDGMAALLLNPVALRGLSVLIAEWLSEYWIGSLQRVVPGLRAWRNAQKKPPESNNEGTVLPRPVEEIYGGGTLLGFLAATKGLAIEATPDGQWLLPLPSEDAGREWVRQIEERHFGGRPFQLKLMESGTSDDGVELMLEASPPPTVALNVLVTFQKTGVQRTFEIAPPVAERPSEYSLPCEPVPQEALSISEGEWQPEADVLGLVLRRWIRDAGESQQRSCGAVVQQRVGCPRRKTRRMRTPAMCGC